MEVGPARIGRLDIRARLVPDCGLHADQSRRYGPINRGIPHAAHNSRGSKECRSGVDGLGAANVLRLRQALNPPYRRKNLRGWSGMRRFETLVLVRSPAENPVGF